MVSDDNLAQRNQEGQRQGSGQFKKASACARATAARAGEGAKAIRWCSANCERVMPSDRQRAAETALASEGSSLAGGFVLTMGRKTPSFLFRVTRPPCGVRKWRASRAHQTRCKKAHTQWEIPQ